MPVQRRSQGPWRQRVMHHGKIATRISRIYLPADAQPAKIEEVSLLRLNRPNRFGLRLMSISVNCDSFHSTVVFTDFTGSREFELVNFLMHSTVYRNAKRSEAQLC